MRKEVSDAKRGLSTRIETLEKQAFKKDRIPVRNEVSNTAGKL